MSAPTAPGTRPETVTLSQAPSRATSDQRYRSRKFNFTYSNHESSPLSSRRWMSQKTHSPVRNCS